MLELIDEVDQKLLLAKELGKNRVSLLKHNLLIPNIKLTLICA